MTGKDRFYRTIERRTTDYPASWLGKPTDEALPGLLSYFESEDEGDLKAAIGDDIFTIDVPYHTRTSSKITTALDFRKGPADGDYKRESLTAAGFFEDYHSLKDVDRFPWPDPAKGLDTEEAKRRALSAPQDSAVMALLWSCHFQDSCSAFGMEQAFIRLMLEPELFKAVIGKITEFYLEANRIFYQTVSKHLDAVLIGNDFGSQQGLMVSPDLLRTYVFPGTKQLIDQAHSYGLKVIHHSCGAIRDIIPDLIDMGVDAIHPIQALASGMDADELARDFGKDVSFCGGVDAQHLLVSGNPDEIHSTVLHLREIFPTGLIISPSHEAILPDIDPKNIEALFKAVRE